MDAAEDILGELARLLTHAGVPAWGVVVGLVLAAVVLVLVRRFGPIVAAWWKANSPPTTPPLPPGTVVDENGPQPQGTPLETDPNRDPNEGGAG